MARVLILSVVFPPDGVSTAHLMGDLAEDLEKMGHEVEVISTEPHYNQDPVAAARQPLRPYWRNLLFVSDYRGVRVLHVAMPAKRGGVGRRLRGWLSFHCIGLLAGIRFVARPDVIIVPSPLLTAGVVAWLIGLVRGSRYIYNVQELYPDLAVQMGWLRNPMVIAVLRLIERFVYATAHVTTGISREICSRIQEKGVSPERVRMIPNFVDLREMCPGSRENAFRVELGVGPAFVVTYAGNLGLAQGLEVLLDAAERVASAPAIEVVLVGDGVLRGALEQRIRERGLVNVRLVGHQPYARVAEIYAASDACVVPLLDAASGGALPSKVFRIMACARPVIAICDPRSELAELVREARAGVVVPMGQPDRLAEMMRALEGDPELRARMGKNGRAFVEARYSRAAVTRQYGELVAALAGGG